MRPNVEKVYNLNNALLTDLSREDVEQLCLVMSMVDVKKGEIFIREGEDSDSVFIIQEGEVEVVKKEASSNQWYPLAMLKKGESIGEVSLLDNNPRSASVRAAIDSKLLEIKVDDLNAMASANDSVTSRIKVNLAREMGKRLRKTNETTVKTLHDQLAEAKARVAIGTIICWLLVGICCYVVVLKSISSIASSAASTTIISVVILAVFGIMTFAAAKRSGYPLSTYGITLDRWKQSAMESILLSMYILL
ncbi:MAG: cyclic nucleotide-binding domain-containing protein, partial [bacterium]